MYENLLDKLETIFEEDKMKVFNAAVYYIDGNGKSVTLFRDFQSVNQPTNCYSVSKTFTATAVGIACDRGLISTENYVYEFFADELPEKMSEDFRKVKIKHLLCQTTGINRGVLFEEDRYDRIDLLQRCIEEPIVFEPGTHFFYSNSNTYLLSRILSKVTGMTLDMFVRKNIFDPLGIKIFAWERDPAGETIGCTGLYLYTYDMIRLGAVYLNNGAGIVSEKWVNEATRDHVCREGQPKYGYCFWVRDDGYEMNGRIGQIVRIFPKRKLVFAAHAGTDYDYNQALYRAFEKI